MIQFIPIQMFYRLHVRERLRIGDLLEVLTSTLKLPKFVKLKLSFKFPTIPLPVNFPKGTYFFNYKHLFRLANVQSEEVIAAAS